ncbi:SDR family oxidoreductase [Acetobacter fallax]|uniref:SDR family oxidoreductase n=1 Tax=Acetobacter fallax TaxID=1737473 RepID=A0ABX0KKA3_9PROT|nr:SDR family oxidoreductase [Acetobacter fallax]NHO34292.1 SDR family oxidoreductase [Acetobacter fallax]NHO37851.1 SDR family oxidoreductase [Acetobacter fallax]
MSSFHGKSVLVLGGSRGIGAAIVRRFATDGAKVIFTYLSSPDDAHALSAETGSKAMRADSGDRDALIALINSLGPLDVLVVNSGILGAGDPLDMPPDDIDRLFRINIHAPYHAAVAAARNMPDGGRIIFIGSANADRMPMSGLAAYSASKSALKGMARGLARDFGARGITVNVVQPGPTDTDMNPAEGPLKDIMHGFMAIKRHATGAEIAGLVAYLAGPEAGIITGAAYNIDGGFAA